MSNTLCCPLCRKTISRNKLFNHLYSATHREKVQAEFRSKRGSLNQNRSTLPFIVTDCNPSHYSFCLGCSKAYCGLKEHGAHVCKNQELHNKLLDEIIGSVGDSPINEIVSSSSADIVKLRSEIDKLKAALKKAESDRDYEKERADIADADNEKLQILVDINISMRKHPAFDGRTDEEIKELWEEIEGDHSLLEYHGR